MVKLSRHLDLEFLSPFWMQYLYAYLDYDEATKDVGYSRIQKMSGAAAWPKIQAHSLSPTGEVYRELISSH